MTHTESGRIAERLWNRRYEYGKASASLHLKELTEMIRCEEFDLAAMKANELAGLLRRLNLSANTFADLDSFQEPTP